MDAKTAVDTIFVGKDRAYNRRFQQMCGHYLVEPVACTPASGWEKGQVENQVGVIRRRLFVPRPRFKSYAELNAWLEDRCVAWAKAHPHPELPSQTVWEVFEAERSSLVPYVGPFDGFHAVPASVSKTCLVRFDNNRYSVEARAVGRPVEIRAYAERVEFWQDGQIVGQHARAFGRSEPLSRHWSERQWRTLSTIRCITSPCSPASPAPCATAPPSRSGTCHRRCGACSASSAVCRTAIARWSRSSVPC